jgi:hypothetical protein
MLRESIEKPDGSLAASAAFRPWLAPHKLAISTKFISQRLSAIGGQRKNADAA